MDSYLKKYRKYKVKYLNMKEQIGRRIEKQSNICQNKIIMQGGSEPKKDKNKIFSRNNLINYYLSVINKTPLVFNTTDTTFESILKVANTTYEKSEEFYFGRGLYYRDEYARQFAPAVDYTTLEGISNIKFFQRVKQNIFVSYYSQLPSDAIRAWFKGPTLTECAQVIQAVIYMYILNKYGDELFNKRFRSPVSQLMITNNLYMPYEEIEKNKYTPVVNNPLHFLFDNFTNPSMSDIRINDIVYIKGVENYPDKHITGNAMGWNLICVDDNEPKKFLGFGPYVFGNGPLTYEDFRRLFIQAYNKDQTSETKERIIKFSDPSYIIDSNEHKQAQRATAILAKALSNDKVSEDSDIDGLQVIMRLNEDVLDNFMHNEPLSWENLDLNLLETEYINDKGPFVKNLIPIRHLIPFSAETEEKIFENYNIENDEMNRILEFSKKFAYHVSLNTIKDYPSGCILSGTPGIGKTHLAVSIAKFVSNCNKKVLYVDSAYFSEKYQLESSQSALNNFSLESSKQILKTSNLLQDIDLIILDDINSNSSSSSLFLEDAMRYIYENNKSILITSNVQNQALSDYIPYYINFNSIFANNFISRYFDMESYRKPWIENCIGIDKMNELAIFNKHQASGIIIEEDLFNQAPHLNSIEKTFNLEFTLLMNQRNTHINEKLRDFSLAYQNINLSVEIKLKIVGPAIEYNINGKGPFVKDLYVHGIENFDIVLIYVSLKSYDSHEQLLKLIAKVHDNKQKIIVVTDSIKELEEKILKELNDSKGNKQRLTDRFKIIFPGII